MRKNVFLFIGLILLFSFTSCTKSKEKENHFSFNGKDYSINDVGLLEEVFNEGEADELSVFQFIFSNINNGDTTSLAVAVLDTNTNVLGGNYPAVDIASESSRAIYPFGLIFFSGVFFQDNTYYLTGQGGSIDINMNNGDYSVTFNNISAGSYTDTNQDGNLEYSEKGKVSGTYEGVIHKERQPIGLQKKDPVSLARLDAMLNKIDRSSLSSIKKK